MKILPIFAPKSGNFDKNINNLQDFAPNFDGYRGVLASGVRYIYDGDNYITQDYPGFESYWYGPDLEGMKHVNPAHIPFEKWPAAVAFDCVLQQELSKRDIQVNERGYIWNNDVPNKDEWDMAISSVITSLQENRELE